MSDAFSIQSLRTTWPFMSIPRIATACVPASSGVGGELDAAGFAATARQHLSLDDDVAAELLCRGRRLLGVVATRPVRDGDAEAGEQLFSLVLVEVHGRGNLPAPHRTDAVQGNDTIWAANRVEG